MLTYLLEQLGETTLRCPSQAALDRISLHAQWRLAAMRWFDLNDDALGQLMEGWPAWTVLAIDFMSVFGIEETEV